MTRTECAAPSSRSVRRSTRVARIVSLTDGTVAIMRRNASGVMTMTSPDSETRAVR